MTAVPRRRFKRSLRLRVAAAFSVFGGLISIVQAFGLYLGTQDLGERLIDDTLTAELEDFIVRRTRNPHSVPEKTATIRAYVIPNPDLPPPPEKVANLSPGRHSIVLDGRPFRAAVRDRFQQRFIVLYDEQQLLRHERGFLTLLGVGVVIMVLLAAVVGHWLAERVIAPVTGLARRVGALRPEDEPEVLATEYPWDAVRYLAAAIDDYHARLHAFIERERLFTSDVSHELRTPLTVINGATEIMLSDPDLTEASRRRLLRIARATAEMSEITEALLVLAREQDGKTPAAACDIDAVVTEVVEKQRRLHQAKPIEIALRIEARPCVRAERAVVAMAVGNLLSNAIAFTDRGRIEVALETDRVTVTDTGRGIAEEAMPHVLEHGYKGPGSTGAGIGLSLVRRICERYGWRLEMESRPAEGTRVTVRFADEKNPS